MTRLSSPLQVPDGVLFREVENAGMLLNTTTGSYYMLDETGARMWELITEYGEVEPVYEALLAEYDVEASRLRLDLTRFIEELVSHELLGSNGTPGGAH